MSDFVRSQGESRRVKPSQARSSEVVRGQAESSAVARGCRTASEVKASQAMAADCVRSKGGSSRVKARYSCRNKRERVPPLDAPKLTIFSFLHTRHLFFLLFDTALSPFRLRSATFRSVPAPFRSVPAPFRYGMAARVLRSVPRAGRHYTRARARYAAPFAPLHYARRACACGGTTLARALVAPPPAPALHPLFVPFRECSGTTLAPLVAPAHSLHYTKSGCAAPPSAPLRPPLHPARPPLGVPFRECADTTLALLVASARSLHSTPSGRRHRPRRHANCYATLRRLRGGGGFPPLHSAYTPLHYAYTTLHSDSTTPTLQQRRIKK